MSDNKNFLCKYKIPDNDDTDDKRDLIRDMLQDVYFPTYYEERSESVSLGQTRLEMILDQVNWPPLGPEDPRYDPWVRDDRFGESKMVATHYEFIQLELLNGKSFIRFGVTKGQSATYIPDSIKSLFYDTVHRSFDSLGHQIVYDAWHIESRLQLRSKFFRSFEEGFRYNIVGAGTVQVIYSDPEKPEVDKTIRVMNLPAGDFLRNRPSQWHFDELAATPPEGWRFIYK